MQTKAEKHLVQNMIQIIKGWPFEQPPIRILNIGAGQSISIERQLSEVGCQYICDRIDVEECDASYPTVGNCWKCSVEAMIPVRSNFYRAGFANYVFEHVSNLELAVKEVHRVLKSGAIFAISVPNPAAIEFWVSKYTPLGLHKKIKQSEVWETHYAYKGIRELTGIFEDNGFLTIDVQYYPVVGCYLHNFPILSFLGKAYDRLTESLHQTNLLGDVCIVFKKQK